MQKDTVKAIFFWAAISNLVIGIPMLALPEQTYHFFYTQELPSGAYHLRLLYSSFGFSVLIFGLGYYLVSRDPAQNHGVVWMGIIGKVSVFFVFVAAYLDGQVNPITVVCAIGDLIWALAFLYTLYLHRKSSIN